MKKCITLLLVLAVVLSFFGCAASGEPEGTHEQGTAPSDTSLEQPSGEETVHPSDDVRPGEEINPSQPDASGAADAEQSQPEGTQPSAGTILATTPGNSQSAQCIHSYQVTATRASTCVTVGTRTYTCSKCESAYTEALALSDHKYTEATCSAPQTCTVCAVTVGSALEHSFGSDGFCTHCGEKFPGEMFTVSVKTDKGIPVEAVTVCIYTDASATIPAATGQTNSSGLFTVGLDKSSRYKVVLSDLPNSYTAEDSYTVVGANRINIKLKFVVVVDPTDHSYADYKVGSTMWDFTVTDTDGNTYNLSNLLKEKKLVILDFWYVTCEPCKAEFPYFEAAYQKYKDDITILAMNHFDGEASIKSLREQLGYTFPMVKESLGMQEAFDIAGYPTTVIINSSGKIVSIHRNPYASETEFLQVVESYLK